MMLTWAVPESKRKPPAGAECHQPIRLNTKAHIPTAPRGAVALSLQTLSARDLLPGHSQRGF